jgi:hypothetical protein
MSCIRIAQSMKVVPVDGGAKRLFLPGEQFEWQGVSIDEQKPCSCGSGFTTRQFAVVTIEGLDYKLDWEMVREANCFDPPATLDVADRLHEIGDGSSFTEKPKQLDNRSDNLQLDRFRKMAKFDLRRPK